MDKENGVESRMLAIVGNPAVIQAMDALKKASEAKDSFADLFAEKVASVDGIRDIIADYDNALAFVKFCMEYRGITGKGAVRRVQNRIAYVRIQSTIALCDKLGIAVPKSKASEWEYSRWLESVRETIASHKINVDKLVSDLTAAKAD